jgi:hypothetical protein
MIAHILAGIAVAALYGLCVYEFLKSEDENNF